MNKIILPIKPLYSEKILNGTKTYELRRIIHKKNVDKVIIYSTSPISKVIGEFNIADIIHLPVKELWRRTHANNGVNESDFYSYFHGKENGYAIQVSNPETYPKPLPLEHFGITHPPQSFIYM